MAITTASSVTTGGVLSVASVSGITTRQTVQLTGTAFGGLVAAQTYYVIAVGSSTITLSLTAYGSAISIAGGSGTMTVTTGPSVGAGVNNIISAGVVGDYNTIQALAAKILGAPTDAIPTYGYNQPVVSSQVAVGNRVSLNHWTNLRSDMIKARGHQSGAVSESNNISLPTNLSLVTEATRSEYLSYVNVIDLYRDILGPGQFTIDTAVIARRIDDWNGNITSTITMNFGDNPTMRAFFNAGGVVKFSVSMTGTFNSFSSLKDNTWNEMFTQMGTVTFDRAGTTLDPGSTGTTTSIGFFNLTNTDQAVFTKNAPSGNYSSNRFIINAKTSSGTLVFTVNYNDLATGAAQINYPIAVAGSQPGTVTNTFTPGGVPDEYIDGIITQNCVIHRPAGSYVSIASPTVSLTGDFQNASNAVYGLKADKYAVNEGDTVTITLQTSNVADGTTVAYTCGGSITYTVNSLSFSRFSSGNTNSVFTVNNNIATISFTVANNLNTDGITSFTVDLTNGLGQVTIFINDTSTTPVGNVLFTTPGGPYTWTSPNGVRNASVLMVAGGGGGGNFGGGGGGAGQARILVAQLLPNTTYSYNIGTGGGSLQNGSSTAFAGNNASGGNGGLSGSSTGHNGSHIGGTGGASGAGTAGGTPGGSNGLIMTLGGGGGGGNSGNGSAGNSTTGGRGGPGLAFTYYGVNTVYVSGGGGGGGTVGSNPTAYTTPGYYGGGTGGGMDTAGSAAPYYGGGGGGGGVALTDRYNVQANQGGNQLIATLISKSGGQGANGFLWIFWPSQA